jgi:hypothetical protein
MTQKTLAGGAPMPDPTYRITTSRGVVRLRSDCRRNAILSALELHGPGAALIRVEIEGEWSDA